MLPHNVRRYSERMSNSKKLLCVALIFTLVLVFRSRFSANEECFRVTTEEACIANPACTAAKGVSCGTGEYSYFGCVDKSHKHECQTGTTHDPRISSLYDKSELSNCPVCAIQPGGTEALFANGTAPYGWQLYPLDKGGCQYCDEVIFRELGVTFVPSKRPKLTILILVWNEFDSLRSSLQSYKENGLFEYVDESLIFIQERNSWKEEQVAPYTKSPYNLKIMGDSNNYGILNGINWLIGNASSEIVMFLEKDFKQIESAEVTKTQLDAGRAMISSGRADIVKYRSRWRAGEPNWAEIQYRGKEQDVFHKQPNLLCNFYHWVVEPDRVWPDKFWKCWNSPTFYCTTAEYCNWTNNPVMFLQKWWMDNYSVPKWKDHNPYKDFEFYMNWEPHAWNDRNWVIASGDGVFEHHEINEAA